MKVGYFQFHTLICSDRKNLANVLSTLEGLEVGTADLIVLRELVFTGYYFKDRDELLALAEDPTDSSTLKKLIELCHNKALYIVTGFAERCVDKVFNSSILIGLNGIEHIYRKLHLFNEEKNVFDAGDTPLSVQEVRGEK